MGSLSARLSPTSLIYLVTTLYWASMYVYMPILPVHAENLGASAGLVGTIVGSYGFTQLLLRIPVGVWSDRIGLRQPFLVAGVVATGIGALGLGLSSDPTWLVVWRGISGAGAAAWVAFTVLFSSYFPPERATQAMTRIVLAQGVGQIATTYAGGMIAQHWGWQAPFFVAVVFALLGLGFVLPLQEKPVAVRRDVTARELLRIATVPLLLAISIATMFSNWSQWATANGFTLVQAARLGASRADLGTLATVMQLSYTAAILASAFVPERIGMRATIVMGLAVQSLGALTVPLADSLWLVAVSQVLAGAGRGICYPVLMGLSIRSVPAADRATAMGVFQGVYALGMFAGPAASGFLGDAFGMSSIFLVAGVATLASMAIVVVFVHPKG